MSILVSMHVQVVEDGYEFFARRQLVTLFSAPNYCGDYDNAGGMMTVDEDLLCSFQVCTYVEYKKCTFSGKEIRVDAQLSTTANIFVDTYL